MPNSGLTSVLKFFRRKFLQEYLEKYGDGNVKIASTASAMILGTPNSMMSSNLELAERIQAAYDSDVKSLNPCTQSQFVPEFTASPHPRFLGLA